MFAVPRDGNQKPKLTKEDQERFIKRKEQVDRKIKEKREKLKKGNI
ncbi:hypothetical protein [Bacillus cereus]|nr:hypothetical protein [Bacillus cereus]